MDKIDYAEVIKQYPWIVERGHKVVLSSDADGLLCGLLMASLLDWEITGFYDGRRLLLKKGLTAKRCIFLDMEIFDPAVRSLGQHLVLYNKNAVPDNWNRFSSAINPNLMRGLDTLHDNARKYPFGAIHLLLAIVASRHGVTIPQSGYAPLLYADGTFKNLMGYTENCLEWFRFLRVNKNTSALYPIFYGDHTPIAALMELMAKFFVEMKALKSSGRRGADKIDLSSVTNGSFPVDVRQRAESFLKILDRMTGWTYDSHAWPWNGLDVYKLDKHSDKPMTVDRFSSVMSISPFSFSFRSAKSLSYTLWGPDKLL